MLRLKEEISELISTLVNIEPAKIIELLEEPPEKEMGDISFPCFILAKQEKKSPVLIAEELTGKLREREGLYWKHVHNKGPYINFFLDFQAVGGELIPEILEGNLLKNRCESEDGGTVVIDYSAPNIAKPFGIGHLRSTIIGNALYRLYGASGFNCVGINHLGDWGTQFGKLIVAYKLWGEEEKIRDNPVDYSFELYVRFHREVKDNPGLDDDAREWFRCLENGEEEAVQLWRNFCHFSLEEFERVYGMLGVKFDYYHGESFYNSFLEQTIELIREKGITQRSEGALIVDLEPYGLPPSILQKKDGTTLYMTRDLAAAIYRYNNFKFERMLYVVGSEQTLHFQQLFKILELMGFDWAQKCVHVPFGLIRFKDSRMSTREGNVILLKDVIEKAVGFARDIIDEKNPDLAGKDTAAQAVGLGAIKFGDLSNDRIKNIDFDWDKVLDFSGETAPYIQYSHARICSIIRKLKEENHISDGHTVKNILKELETEEEKSLLKELSMMTDVIMRSVESNKPSVLARYLVDVAREFNRFYHNCPVINAGVEKQRLRLTLIQATREVLAQGLDLLGINAPEEM